MENLLAKLENVPVAEQTTALTPGQAKPCRYGLRASSPAVAFHALQIRK
jgi:hypothetical protein